MSLQVGLNIATLIMCVFTLAVATAALMPQIKHGLTLLRDALLWCIVIGFIGLVGFVGWSRFNEARIRRSQGDLIIAQPLRFSKVPKVAAAQSIGFANTVPAFRSARGQDPQRTFYSPTSSQQRRGTFTTNQGGVGPALRGPANWSNAPVRTPQRGRRWAQSDSPPIADGWNNPDRR